MKFNKQFISRLRHYIKFSTILPDGSFEDVSSAFAEISPITDTSVKEFDEISFGHLLTEEYFLITTRYLRNLNSSMRIRFNDRIFAIKRIINPYELNHILKIIAQELTEE
jgi:head-tail adaptor